MKVSIAMATYNGEKYLEEQLESFLTQSRLPDELVVSDDASSDRTVEILEAFKRRAPFEVVIIKNGKNVGFTKNFERAISKTTGDIIFLSDQDDVWFGNKISSHLKVFSTETNIHLTICDMNLCDNNLKSLGYSILEKHKIFGICNATYAHGCAMAFSKELKNIAIPFPSDKYWNHDFWINAIANYLDMRKLINQSLQKYRRHSNALSINSKISNTFKKNIISILTEDLPKKNITVYKIKYIRNQILLERIKDHLNWKIIKDIELESKCASLRYLTLKSKLFRRFPYIIKQFELGGYGKYYKGIKSVIKDLIWF